MNREAPSQSSKIKSDIVDLISRQRLLRLKEGSRFPKYSSKGQRIKDKYWFCRLSPNLRELQYGDLNDNSKDADPDELANKINISDIKGLFVGKDCPYTKDGHMKKTSVDLALSIVYESDHEDHLNFVALDHKTFCYWVDGMNHLLMTDMTSEEFQKDLAVLMNVEMKIKSLDM